MSGWRRPSVRTCVRSDFFMLLTTQFSGRVRDVVQTLTRRDEIIVLIKATIIVKEYCSRSRIVQIFIFIFILYTSSMAIYGTV